MEGIEDLKFHPFYGDYPCGSFDWSEAPDSTTRELWCDEELFDRSFEHDGERFEFCLKTD